MRPHVDGRRRQRREYKVPLNGVPVRAVCAPPQKLRAEENYLQSSPNTLAEQYNNDQLPGARGGQGAQPAQTVDPCAHTRMLLYNRVRVYIFIYIYSISQYI